MKLFGIVATLTIALFPVTLSAQPTAVGTWETIYVGSYSDEVLMGPLTFTIQETPAGLKGTASAEAWPGELVVSNVRQTGNRLTFTGTGKVGSTSRIGNAPPIYSCCPELSFDGVIEDNKMKLIVIWGSTDSAYQGRPQLFEATRTINKPTQ